MQYDVMSFSGLAEDRICKMTENCVAHMCVDFTSNDFYKTNAVL